MKLEQTVIDEIVKLLVEDDLPIPEISGDTVLLETGIDSLGFAVLVTRLEEILGYDPFSLMTDAVYPRTLSDFVAIYEAHAPS